MFFKVLKVFSSFHNIFHGKEAQQNFPFQFAMAVFYMLVLFMIIFYIYTIYICICYIAK